jgi:BirA family biotin operon repressor/biotin-[acetyl-CoA-carboxylase] ligase
VVLAESQSAGRGRLNRSWASPPGVGVYMSILLRPADGSVPLFLYTFLPAVAAAAALRQVSGLPVFIHWPNDLTLRGGKLAGILAEARSGPDHPREVIIGMGLNVNHTPADFPAELRGLATSLQMAAGRRFSRAEIVRLLLRELERGYALLRHGRGADVLAAWKRLCPSHFGTPVAVVGGPGGPVQGTTRGIDQDGALLVERRDGGMERVAFGEVRRIRGGRGAARP